jgi:type IV pilus assembly protein PilW
MKAVSRHPISPGPLRRARGFTLVELMVSITVALFLIGGILTVVQHTRNTFTVQNQLAQLQDSERIAMTLIAGVVQTAGYYPAPTQNTALTALPVTTVFTTAGTPTILGTNQTAASSTTAAGDTITVRYAVAQNDNAFNCMGSTNTGALDTWENTFEINAQNQLVCSFWSKNANKTTTAVLVNGVTNLQITYGVNTKGISSANSCVDTYITSALMAAANWPNVCTVVVTLTFTNPVALSGGPNQTVQFSRVIAVMNMVGVTT